MSLSSILLVLKKITVLEPESIDLEAQWFAPIGKTTFRIKKYLLIFLSLTLYPSLTLSFTLSALSGFELSPSTFGFVEIGLMYIYSFLPQPSRSESPTIGFAET